MLGDARLAPQQTARIEQNDIGDFLAPCQIGNVDRLVMSLSRRLIVSKIDTTLVVLGRCIDDIALMAAGNVFVAGTVEFEDYARAIDQYEIGRLFSPYRTSHFWLLDALANAAQLPKAYFDWSYGSFVNETGDLALDPRACDERAALQIAAWLCDELAEDFPS